MKSDAILGRQNPSGPIMQPCLSGGLWDGGAGISVGDEHVANWLIGQVRNETQNDEQMLKYAESIGADMEEFREALSHVTRMSTEQFKNVCNSLSECPPSNSKMYAALCSYLQISYQSLPIRIFCSEKTRSC